MRQRYSADVAIYAPFAGALYRRDAVTGGAEMQSFLIARSLAAAGLRVRHVVANARVGEHGGVAVVPLPRAYERGSFISRRRAIARTLHSADAAVYVQRSAGFETGIVALVARARRRSFVFSSSSDSDFVFDRATSQLTGGSLDHLPTLVQYRLGLRLADRIVVQTEEQARLADAVGARGPRVIPSFCPVVGRRGGAGTAFLWIGAATAVKEPLAYVRLAATVPEAVFRMILADRGEGWRWLAAEVRDAAAVVPNLQLIDERPRDELTELYDDARAVVGTSMLEGFPNTFLEAWARGRPTISLRIDPAGVIRRYGLGVSAGGSEARLAEAARWLWHEPDEAKRLGAAGLEYVRSTHDPSVVGPRWEALVRELVG